MLGIEDYGSDVESGDETSSKTADTSTTHIHTTSKSSLALPPPRSSLTLPPPLASTSSTTAGASSASSKPKRTKKIAINLLPLPSEYDEDDGPPAKKARVAPSTGAGKSSLLSMLPAPKQPIPVIEKKAKERVLGGGSGPGLVFHVAKVDADDPSPPTSLLPPSLQKSRANVSVESDTALHGTAPSVGFFSLGPHTTTPTPSTSTSVPITRAPSSASAPSRSVSSAPTISTFRPPSPTLDDPYPGYYQLPSGAYAPYDAEYYGSYARRWKAEYDKQIRALEKAQYEPETDGAQDVDMAAEMDKARREVKEREDKKALTTGKVGLDENGEPVMPRMNVKGAKLGSVARSRHQLTTLLTEAYLNRDALEEKIAQGRRNRKEAGNKYGF